MSTVQELYGLKAIVMFIHALPVTRKSVPSLISNAVELIKDIRTIVDTHKVDIYITLYDITLHYVTGRLPGQVRDGQAAAELARPRQRQEEEAGRRQEGQRGQHRQGETLSFNSFLHNLLAPD